MSSKAIALGNNIEASKALNIALWAIQLGAAYMFIMAGYSKLSGDPQMVGLFDVIGLGQWFRYLTGGLELGGGLLLLTPTLAGVAGIILSGVMMGAILTHLFVIGGSAMMATLLLVASIAVAIGRLHRTLKLKGRH